MGQALKVTEAVSLALHAMFMLALNPGRLMAVKDIASILGVSEAHLSKVFQRLARVGMVRSVRGPHGGFAIAKPSDEITLLEVYESIDGPLVPSDCLLGAPICGGRPCILGGLPKKLNQEVRNYLAKTRLSDVAGLGERGGAEGVVADTQQGIGK